MVLLSVDSIALAERINLFWSIFQADRTGSIGTGLPVVIRDEEIETPWPRRFEDFELVSLRVDFFTSIRRSPDLARPPQGRPRSL